MPQINSAIPICNEQTPFKEYHFTSWNEINNEPPPGPKLISQKANNFEEDFSSQVTESDSGFLTGSDEEDRLNSGSCSAEDFDLNIILEPGSVSDTKNSFDFLYDTSKKDNDISSKFTAESFDKNYISIFGDHDNKATFADDFIQEPGFYLRTTNSFDFWNKTTKKENDVKNNCIAELTDEHLSSLCSDHNNETSLSDEVGSFLNLLNVVEKSSVSNAKKISASDNFDVPVCIKQETVNDSNSDLNFYEFLNEISVEKDFKIFNVETHQNILSNGKSSGDVIPPSYECFKASNDSSLNLDNVYSDLFTSLNLDDSCNDGSSRLNSVTNNDINSDKLKNSVALSNNTLLSESDESLSDILAAICVEGNAKNKTLSIDTISNENGLINEKSCDIDINEISLASLAEEYLSSGAPNNFLSTSSQDNYIYLSEDKSVYLDISSETSVNHLIEDNSQGSFGMRDLFAAFDKECDDTTINLQLKSDLDNIGSQTTCSRTENAVVEKSIHNDESLEDETDGDVEIDLTSCLKSDKLPSSPSKCLSAANSKTVQEADSDPFYLHSSPIFLVKSTGEMCSPLTKSKRTNSNQSLFAKALSCKPKRDKSAVLKALSIKKQFCERLFNPPRLSFPVKPLKPVAYPTNDFIYSSLGRRIFEQGNFREVK